MIFDTSTKSSVWSFSLVMAEQLQFISIVVKVTYSMNYSMCKQVASALKMPIRLPLVNKQPIASSEPGSSGISLQLPSALTAILTSRKAETAEAPVPMFFGDVSTPPWYSYVTM